MSWSCICIVAPLSLRFQTRIRRSIPTVGAATRPGGRSAGNWWPNGSGTSVSNWGISWRQRLCASPHSLLPFPRASRLPRVRPHLYPPLAMVHPRRPPRGRGGASRGRTFDGTLRCPAGQSLRVQERRREADGSLRVVYGWCQHSQVSSLSAAPAVPVEWQRHCKTAPGQRAVASSPGGFCPAPLARLEPQRTPARLSAARAIPTHRGEPGASCRRLARQSGSDPVPPTTRTLSSLLARAAGSQCSRFNIWASDHQTVWCPRKLCHLTRFGDGLTSS
jgi:hypothetical protein